MSNVRVNINVNVSTRSLKDFKKALEILSKEEVLVGVPAEDTKRKKGEITNAALAYIHDTGSPAQNIPARPFMVPGIKNAADAISKQLKRASEKVLDGDVAAAHNGLVEVGLVAQRSIRQKITEGPFAALKTSTLRARQRRGRTGNKPLIDTGQLRNSINYVVRRKKK